MPLYEYNCGACNCNFEMIRKLSESDKDVECPECGKKKAKRLMSGFSTSKSGGAATGGSSCGSSHSSGFS